MGAGFCLLYCWIHYIEVRYVGCLLCDGCPNCFIANKFDFNVNSGAIICMARRLHSQEYVRENLLHWIFILFAIFFSHQHIWYWADNKKHFFKMNFAENNLWLEATYFKIKNTVDYRWYIGNLFFTFMIILIFN